MTKGVGWEGSTIYCLGLKAEGIPIVLLDVLLPPPSEKPPSLLSVGPLAALR